MQIYLFLAGLLLISPLLHADTLIVKSDKGEPLARVMVTQTPVSQPEADLSDDGYAPDGVTNTSAEVITRFTNTAGEVNFDTTSIPVRYRVRAQGYVDNYFSSDQHEISLQAMTEQQLIASYPSNVWLSQLDFGGDLALKKRFQLNCAFCHQQASPFMRNERTEEQWVSVIERMNSYGARLPESDHHKVAQLLQKEYRQLREHPESVPRPRPWDTGRIENYLMKKLEPLNNLQSRHNAPTTMLYVKRVCWKEKWMVPNKN